MNVFYMFRPEGSSSGRRLYVQLWCNLFICQRYRQSCRWNSIYVMYLHVYMCMYMLCMYLCVCIYYVCIYVYVHAMYVFMCTYTLCMYLCVCIYYVCIYVYVYTYICTYPTLGTYPVLTCRLSLSLLVFLITLYLAARCSGNFVHLYSGFTHFQSRRDAAYPECFSVVYPSPFRQVPRQNRN
jgi:hypothetical protein